ncbi:MAG: hypothetical protein ACYTBV_20395, partial [Planctomycetota bacterium]
YVSYQAFYHRKDFLESKVSRRVNAEWLAPAAVFYCKGMTIKKWNFFALFAIIENRSLQT